MQIRLKNAVLRGTIILTVASILSRIIGFYYRIFLTRNIGAEGMGIFQLIIPIMGITFAFCSAGIQTAISKFCAQKDDRLRYLPAGLLISLPISIGIAFLTYYYADFLAIRILLNERCIPLIKIFAVSIPFSSFHNCVNGYYFGGRKAGIPAGSQLVEQIVRVTFVYIYVFSYTKKGMPVTVECAILGNLASEIASAAFMLLSLIIDKHFHWKINNVLSYSKKILLFSLPLTANRLLMHLLQSGEVILIPAQLMVYGHSSSEALSIYGVLTGMALPLILFPSAITNSLSVMLLPEVSNQQSENNNKAIVTTLNRSIRLCITMGILFTMLFVMYIGKIGAIAFDEPMVNTFTVILAWLCPFCYLATTLSSILNGLGKTTTTCIQNVCGILVRIAFLILLVPQYGIKAYLYGLLISQLLICLCNYISLKRLFHIRFNAVYVILYPILYAAISLAASLCLYVPMEHFKIFSEIIRLLLGCSVAFFVFLIMNRKNLSALYRRKIRAK